MLENPELAKFIAKNLANTGVSEGTSYGRLNMFLCNKSIDSIAKAVPDIFIDFYKKNLPSGVTVSKGTDGKAQVSIKNPGSLRPEDYLRIAAVAMKIES